jgi:hypothetical protein
LSIRLSKLEKYRDAFLTLERKAREQVKFQEESLPIDEEYVKRHGEMSFETEDLELAERRLKAIEDDLGIKRGTMDFLQIEDPFVMYLAMTYGSE